MKRLGLWALNMALPAALVATAFPACTESCMEGEPDDNSLHGDSVSVTVNFCPDTKTSWAGVGSDVDNVCLWVFREDALDSYVFLEGQQSAALTLADGGHYSFYALANTYRNWESTEDDSSDALGIQAKSQLDDMVLYLSDFSLGTAGRSLPMAATSEVDVKAGTPVTLELVRLFSKVTFTFDPDEDLSLQNVVITSVRMKNTASVITPFRTGSYTTSVADGDLASMYDLQKANSGESLDFYCLENCCGSSDNTDSRTKFPEGAQYGTPTYLEVTADVSGFQLSGSVTWRFCLGTNEVDNYDLERGTIYYVTLHSLFSSVDSGTDDWQIDTGDITKDQGTPVQLYLGQFHKFKLDDGDGLWYYDSSEGHWVNFINYTDDDYAAKVFDNGICLVTYWSDENNASCNPDCYVYSTAKCGSGSAAIKIIRADNTEERYNVLAPTAPSKFSNTDAVTVCEDGYGIYSLNVALNGSLGSVDATEFAIPTAYLGADLPCSVASDGNIGQGSDRWALYRRLYSASVKSTGGATSAYAGCETDFSESSPQLTIYGKTACDETAAVISTPTFRQTMELTVTEAFPDQGDLGSFMNYEFAPNSLKSTDCCTLPSGITSHVSWTLDDGYYISVSSGKVKFGYPLGSRASAKPAMGRFTLDGSVTNPYTGRVIDGEYTFEVVLYLPLIASEIVAEDGSGSTVVGSTVAVATTSTFHSDLSIWEDVFSELQIQDDGFEAVLKQGSTSRSIVPVPSFDDAQFTVNVGSNIDTYTPTFLARYVPVNLVGFRTPDGGSASTTLDLQYARLVRFEDVNTQLTPAVSVYGQGESIYECLWGRRSD